MLPDLDSTTYVHFESIDPEENRFRFYTITWQQTLWGEWTMRATWGRIGTMGRGQVTYFESEEALRETLPGVVARRLKRGYLPKGVVYSAGRRTSAPVGARVHQLIALQRSVHTDKCSA
jgi:predicted DNA-binding WGR domain protein